MVKYIELGEYNKNYNFIFLAVSFNILMNYFPQLLMGLLFECNKISIRVKVLYSYSIIRSYFSMFNMLIYSCILYKYENKISKSDSNVEKLNDSKADRGCFKNIKISEEKKEKINNRKIF